MSDIYEQIGESSEFARWLEASSADDPQRAIACAELLVHAFPDNPKAWLCLGSSRYGGEDDEGALAAWERAVELAEAVRAGKPEAPSSGPPGPEGGPERQEAWDTACREVVFALREATVFSIALEGVGQIQVALGNMAAACSSWMMPTL